MTHIAQRQTNW